MSSTLLSEIDQGESRQTVRDWENTLQTIQDSYERHRGVPHGVQKDAIQNGWDARLNERGTDWGFEFHLIEGEEHEYLVMQDFGTTGLTGRVLEEEEYFGDLDPEERWGRFESVAFTKDPEGEAIGSRGQGKFVFVAASEQNLILYDTLREDDTYRLGAREVTQTQSPVTHWDNEDARETLQRATRGSIPALETQGSRVVIVDPVDELVEAIETKEFHRYIGETWWEILLKYDVDIGVKFYDEDIEYVDLPEGFDLVDDDTDTHRIWVREHFEVENDIEIKELRLVHTDPGNLRDDIRGVCIQRGGMKVDSIEPKYLPENIATGIYGYVTVEEEVEKQLKKAEDPEHYGFDYRSTAPRALRDYIREACKEFADEKLGWSRDQRAIQRQRQRNAERKALSQINRVVEDLDFEPSSLGVGTGTGGGTGGPTGGEGSQNSKLLRVEMSDLEFPNEGYRRVNYGEELENISASVYNDTGEAAEVQLRVYLRFEENLQKTYAEEELSLNPGEFSEEIGPYVESVTETDFPNPGKYTVVARVNSLMEENRGDVLDEKRRHFYIEEEPPGGDGIFEQCNPVEYPEQVSYVMGEAIRGEAGGYILEYNTEHPECQVVVDDEDELAQYLFRLMCLEICRLDLSRQDSELFEDQEMDDPAGLVSEIAHTIGKFSKDYYS